MQSIEVSDCPSLALPQKHTDPPIVITVCTDNASNDVSMLNELHILSLPHQGWLPIIGIPCVAHTANVTLGDFLTESRRSKPCDIRRIIAALPDYSDAPFSDIPRLREGHWFSLGENTTYIMIPCPQVIGFLTENEETETMAAMNRLDIFRLNDVMAIFMRFIKYAEGNFISCFDMLPMS
jgi:hypothetical protein